MSGKRILVTGASRGLGRALATDFAARGADVAFTYSSDEKGAAETARAIAGAGARCLPFKVSVLDPGGLRETVARIEAEWKGIDVLVNNAGVSQALPIALMEEADWDGVIDVNLKGTYLASRAVVAGMVRRRSGVILNIGSLAGMRILEAPIHYCASKAAVRAFTEALAKEVARYNVRVNCLAPGLLEEGVARNLPDYRLEEFLKQLSLGRRGTFGEVARFAAFLVSDRNSYMNGASVVMDGGL